MIFRFISMLIGHQRILNFLKKSIEQKKIAHAYLFIGPENVGKKRMALEFIKMLIGVEIEKVFHPDVLLIEPKIVEKNGVKKEKEITIEEVRTIRHQIGLFPYQASYKIVLIDMAEQMTRDAANALLKTLEEPSGQAVLILITSKPQLLLPTIISRCQTIKFLPVPAEEIEKSLEQSKFHSPNLKKIVRLSGGRPGLALRYLENPSLIQAQNQIISELQRLIQSDLNDRCQYAEILSKNIAQARQTLGQWLIYFRDLLLLSADCGNLVLFDSSFFRSEFFKKIPLARIKNIIKAIRKTDWLLANPSINARLALEVLMLEF